MSRKHNCKHPERGRNSEEGASGYQKRLRDRGLGKAPRMADLDGLRAKQLRRVRETCTMGPEHDGHKCNGSPFPRAAELGDGFTVALVEAEPGTTEVKPERKPRTDRPKDTRPPRPPRDHAHPSPRERAPRIGTPRKVA